LSDFADPSKAFLPLDGDAFRAPAGTALPADIFAATLDGWDAYGGIKAGFVVETTRETTKLYVFNAEGPYRVKKGQKEPQLRFRPVDQSKATAMTNLMGGSVVAAGGGYEHIQGDEEQFATIIRVKDGDEWIAYYAEKSELDSIPGETLDGEDLVGYDYVLVPLIPDGGGVPLRRFTKTNPLA
jgi:hypothetical protein